MKNIALILGAFAGAGNRANAIPMPDFNAVEVQGPRDNAISAKGSTQTDEAVQSPYTGRTDYKMPVENELLPQTYPQYQDLRNFNYNQDPNQDLRNFNYNQDPRNFNQYWPGQDQPSAYSSQYWPGQVYKQQPRNKAPVSDQAPDPNQSLNLNSQKDQPKYKQPSSQDRVFETSNTEPAENSEVIDSEVIDSEVIDSEVIDSELINTELINTELINSELIDSELIDAVVVFKDFDCDLHEIPSVEDAQKKIQKYFFSSVYRFNGLKSIKILKREGKKPKDDDCDSMIVHYQASVLKSISQTKDFFKKINERIGLSFEDEHHSFGYRRKFNKLYAFKISDFMQSLINDLVDNIKGDVEKIIEDNDNLRIENKLEFNKLVALIHDDKKLVKPKKPEELDEPIDITDRRRRRRSVDDPASTNGPENFELLKVEYALEKTRDEVNKCKNDMDCRDEAKEVIIYLPKGSKRSENDNYEAVYDLLAILGEEEFMNKFIGAGNKKIATKIAQIKSDEEKKLLAAQYVIWKFVEDRAESEAELNLVDLKYVKDLDDLIKDLTDKKKNLLKSRNKSENKIAGPKDKKEFMEKHQESVKDLTETYVDIHMRDEQQKAANENLGWWLGINGIAPQEPFWDWEAKMRG